MAVFGVSMVKDEIDIIKFTLENMLNQDVDHIFVNDNLSSDGTENVLRELSKNGHITVFKDNEVAYYQSEKMTALAHKAFQKGADWVVPFDADECWVVPGSSVGRLLGSVGASCCLFTLYNYFPHDTDSLYESNPFKRIVSRDKEPAPLPKVAVKNVPDLVVQQGNHGASGKGMTYFEGPGIVGHFPWRTYQQFKKKVSNGYKAYQASDLSEEMGAHWRNYGKILEEHGDEGLKSHFDTWFSNPELPTVNNPVFEFEIDL
jgi:hypothetical protein